MHSKLDFDQNRKNQDYDKNYNLLQIRTHLEYQDPQDAVCKSIENQSQHCLCLCSGLEEKETQKKKRTICASYDMCVREVMFPQCLCLSSGLEEKESYEQQALR